MVFAEHKFTVPSQELELAAGRGAVADGEPVLVAGPRLRFVVAVQPIGVAAPNLGDHKVDEVIDVQVRLNLVVGAAGSDACRRDTHHGVPGGLIARVGDRAAAVGSLDHVPIGVGAAQVIGSKALVRQLSEVVNSPILAVDV
jgi:hypothetical protein